MCSDVLMFNIFLYDVMFQYFSMCSVDLVFWWDLKEGTKM